MSKHFLTDFYITGNTDMGADFMEIWLDQSDLDFLEVARKFFEIHQKKSPTLAFHQYKDEDNDDVVYHKGACSGEARDALDDAGGNARIDDDFFDREDVKLKDVTSELEIEDHYFRIAREGVTWCVDVGDAVIESYLIPWTRLFTDPPILQDE